MHYKRINLFAGPGASKSTTATKLFTQAKEMEYNVELVREYVKDWAWEDRKPRGFDQVYLFAKQLHREEVPLRGGAEFIITDCPIVLNALYAVKNGLPFAKDLLNIASAFEKEYPSINLFIDRGDRPYNTKGRWGTLEEAKEMDRFILDQLNKMELYITTIKHDNTNNVLRDILE